MLKHVSPADPGAAIPDPERGRDLPPEGAVVTWSAYWAGRLARQEITAADPAASDPEPVEVEPAEPEPVELAGEPAVPAEADAPAV